MPYIKIQTNIVLHGDEKNRFCSALSAEAAAIVGKPEDYVLTVVQDAQTLLFGGSDAPAAFLEVKSIGLAEERLKDISGRLSAFLEKELSLDPGRIYIEFADAPGPWWGWNGSTF